MAIIKGAVDIGKYVGMSKSMLHRHKDKDRLPYYRAGRNICARSEDLDAWMKEQIEKNWIIKE